MTEGTDPGLERVVLRKQLEELIKNIGADNQKLVPPRKRSESGGQEERFRIAKLHGKNNKCMFPKATLGMAVGGRGSCGKRSHSPSGGTGPAEPEWPDNGKGTVESGWIFISL